ncbi:glycosyltransferase family 4 protein [Prochlorococcus marinus]|uniref:glycosyltransferase family 4 protein n=1 Tax=Prochlorococcus marinus TaxID=1219 RepID=UPI000190058E|nr:glycosyltransferase family 1 protein [Prochlorococcus marinus]EEE40979.1 glycosyltransferase [Prochlorococcus marinus str. MIT 9202]
MINEMKYNIAIDLRYVENKNSGLSRFSINIFNHFLDLTAQEDIHYIILLPPKSLIKDDEILWEFKSSKIIKIYSKRKRGFKWKLPFFLIDISLYKKLKNANIDFFISPYIDPPLLPGIKVISTIHDLIFIRVNDYFNYFRFIKKIISEFRILLTILSSYHLLTVSNTSKNILINRYKYLPFFKKKLNDITVIYNGITKFEKKDQNYNYKKRVSKKDYFLYVGDRRNHKNLFYTIELIKKYNNLYKNDYELIIAGSNNYKNKKLTNYILAHSFVKEIINPNDELLDYLYRGCKSLILLSFDEGFGIPVIEAAARSKKIILSNIPVFREIAPPNTLMLDLKIKNDHIELVHEYLNKKLKFDSQNILKKWTWRESALKLKKLLLNQLF